jgi:hypothetical protein
MNSLSIVSSTALKPLPALIILLLSGCAATGHNPETATIAAAAKTPASKTVTNFTPALRCMDDMLLAYGKKDIVITTAGLPDSTGKVQTGTKDMLHTAASKMSIKSKSLVFIDYDTTSNDLLTLFQDIQAAGAFQHKLPNYYIRGAITQLDENALDSQAGAGISLPFMDFGLSKDQVSSVVSIDMNMGETTSRMILPGVNASNSLIVTRAGKSADGGGKIGKAGISFNMSMNKSEGISSGVRALVELGMIELVGKLTGTPYWKCLQIDKTNPVMLEQAREWYDSMAPADRYILVQRKLAGMNRYKGKLDGLVTPALTSAIGSYQSEIGLIADGRINFDLYYALLDADQPIAEDPTPTKVAAIAVPQAQVAQTKVTPMTMSLETATGTDPKYRVKDKLQAQAQLTRDGVLYCYYKDAIGNIARIYPNRFTPDPFVRANQMVKLPPENSPFHIMFDKANVKEQLVCYASDNDLAIPENIKGADLTPLKVSSIDEIGNALRKSNSNVVESIINISVE